MQKLSVKIKPSSQQQTIKTDQDGTLIICLKSPPTDGKANTELINLFAKTYAVKKSQVGIKSGLSSKIKQIEID